MSINIGPPQVDELKPRIAVIGVGGAGGNAIANMIAARVEGVDFVVANTDAQALNASPAERRIQLGTQITQGLGAGSRPEVGRAAAEEEVRDGADGLDEAAHRPQRLRAPHLGRRSACEVPQRHRGEDGLDGAGHDDGRALARGQVLPAPALGHGQCEPAAADSTRSLTTRLDPPGCMVTP